MKRTGIRKLSNRLVALVMAVMTVFSVLPAGVQAATAPGYPSHGVSDLSTTDAGMIGAAVSGTCTGLAFAASSNKSMTLTEKMNAFIKDSRWKSGTAWGARKPKLSTYSSSGCCAYCADFVKYVYGSNNLTSGTKFKKISEIRAGDVIYTASYDSKGKVKSQHWIVVIARKGNKLTTADANVTINGRKVTRVSSTAFSISGNTIKGLSNGKTFRYGYHYKN